MPNVVRIRNHATTAQSRWANFVMPRGHALDGNEYLDAGRGRIAVRNCRNFNPARDAIGGDWIYTVHDNWPANSSENLTLAALGSDPRWSFLAHGAYGSGACANQVWDNRRWARVTLQGMYPGREQVLNLRTTAPPTEVYRGPRYVVLRRELHQGGWHVEQFLYLWHQQRLAKFTLNVCWSDDAFESDDGSVVTDGTATGSRKAWSTRCSGFTVDFEGSTLVRGKWQENEDWRTTAGTRLTSAQTVREFAMSTTFTAGTGANDWGNWAGRWWHGPKWQLRGWMSTDSAELAAASHLEGVMSAEDWDGHYLLSGYVPPLPMFPSPVQRPDYSDTTKHWMSWNRGTGGSRSQGLCPNRNTSSQGYQGSYGGTAGGAVLYGFQPLYDLECGMLDWARRPRWIRRDGALPRRGTTPGPFPLNENIPFTPGASREPQMWNFGRSAVSGSRNAPVAIHRGYPVGSGTSLGQVGEDAAHHSNSTLIAHYQLTLDPATYGLIVDDMVVRGLDQKIPGQGGSTALVHRMYKRKLNAIAQIAGVLPSGDELAIYARGTIGFGASPPPDSFKAGTLANAFFLNNPTADRPWLSAPKIVDNPEIVRASTTLHVSDSTDEMWLEDGYWIDKNGNTKESVSGYVVVEGGSNAGYHRVASRRVTDGSVSCTITGGNTVTIDSGTWLNTPNVGRYICITGTGNTRLVGKVTSSSSTQVVVSGTPFTNADPVSLRIFESTLDVDVGHDIATGNDWVPTGSTTNASLTTESVNGVRVFQLGNVWTEADNRIFERQGNSPTNAPRIGYHSSAFFDTMGGAGLYTCYLATGDTDWRDWAERAVAPMVRYLACVYPDGKEYIPWIALVDRHGRAESWPAIYHNAGAPSPTSPAATISESPWAVAGGGLALRQWVICALNFYRQLPAGVGTMELKQKAQRMFENLLYDDGGTLKYQYWCHAQWAATTANPAIA